MCRRVTFSTFLYDLTEILNIPYLFQNLFSENKRGMVWKLLVIPIQSRTNICNVTQCWASWFFTKNSDEAVETCGHNVSYRRNVICFHLSCFHLVCFLRKSTEFHDVQTECQIIIIHFLLIISHKPPACAKCCPPPYFLSLPHHYQYFTKVVVYIKRRWLST